MDSQSCLVTPGLKVLLVRTTGGVISVHSPGIQTPIRDIIVAE